jgi:endonuclease/exonuclease/phosphatase family metal-dependent hydrolase
MAPHPPAIRVASYNVHKCVGLDRQYRPDRIARVIGELGADLVALQEVDRRFGRRTGLLCARTLADESGLELLRVSELPDGQGWHGNTILIRPGTVSRFRRLALPGAEPRGALVVDLDLAGGALRVVAAHFGLLPGCRARQAEAVLHALAEAGPPRPTILLGDLNEWRRTGRPLRVLERVFGAAPHSPASFPSRLPILPLDRILGWPQGVVRGLEVHDTPLARIASDHLPLKARVELPAATPLAAAA